MVMHIDHHGLQLLLPQTYKFDVGLFLSCFFYMQSYIIVFNMQTNKKISFFFNENIVNLGFHSRHYNYGY